MNYTYRVTLAGIKGFFRLYTVNGKNSLYTFHKQLQSDLEFPVDQQILFKSFNAAEEVIARYALVDLGAGTVDNITIEDTIKAGINHFVYFYDCTAKKSVIITLEGTTPSGPDTPTLLESKGPVPFEFENGYVAFEDLPTENKVHLTRTAEEIAEDAECEDEEDDDDEEDEENEDKEEEELIYDENEQ